MNMNNNMKVTYSGSRYPVVPLTSVVTCRVASLEINFESPKSATLASILPLSSMLLVFTSRWIILGLHPVCKYSNPATFKAPLDQTHVLRMSWQNFISFNLAGFQPYERLQHKNYTSHLTWTIHLKHASESYSNHQAPPYLGLQKVQFLVSVSKVEWS